MIWICCQILHHHDEFDYSESKKLKIISIVHTLKSLNLIKKNQSKMIKNPTDFVIFNLLINIFNILFENVPNQVKIGKKTVEKNKKLDDFNRISTMSFNRNQILLLNFELDAFHLSKLLVSTFELSMIWFGRPNRLTL